MRSSNILQRGAKGYGWYSKFLQEGKQGFKRYQPPTPFDWTQKNEVGEIPKRPHAFFDIRIDNEKLTRIQFELASDIVPKTVNNFKNLCLGLGTKFGGYKGTKIHYTSKGVSIMAGDIVTETSSGTGNWSASDSKYFNDENYIIPHSAKGLLRYAVYTVQDTLAPILFSLQLIFSFFFLHYLSFFIFFLSFFFTLSLLQFFYAESFCTIVVAFLYTSLFHYCSILIPYFF